MNYRLAGVILNVREYISKNSGKKFIIVLFSDMTGSIEVIFWYDLWEKYKTCIEKKRPIMLTLSIKMYRSQIRFIGKKVDDLEYCVSHLSKNLKIYLRSSDPLLKIRHLLETTQKGKGIITFIILSHDNKIIEFILEKRYTIGPLLIDAIRTIPNIEYLEQR